MYDLWELFRQKEQEKSLQIKGFASLCEKKQKNFNLGVYKR